MPSYRAGVRPAEEPDHEERHRLLGRPFDGQLHERPVPGLSEALAKGGAALVSSATSPLTRDVGAPMPGFKIFADDYVPGWQRWADALHQHDCLAFHQLFHLGPMTPLFVTAPCEITVAEIEDIVDLFASAAERMKRAGLDGTEVNGACNHLLNNFLSRAWNKRDTRRDGVGAEWLRDPRYRDSAKHFRTKTPTTARHRAGSRDTALP